MFGILSLAFLVYLTLHNANLSKQEEQKIESNINKSLKND